jgi:hypothetical protein
LELRLDGADLAVDIREQTLRHLPNITLDLSALIIDHAEPASATSGSAVATATIVSRA